MNSPKVSILLATYNPRLDWFELLLNSLNNQDYKNLDLIVLDDCSTNISFNDLIDFIKNHISKFEVSIKRNDFNMGSNLTFEKLTQLGDGDYFAYCDQDDIWHSNKISTSINHLKINNKKCSCSDVDIINEDGIFVCDSITKKLKHFTFSPDNQFRYLLSKNFAIGCTMLVERNLALASLPFFKSLVHDHIIAITASFNEELLVINDSLIDYRMHSSNQTGTLKNIKTAEDYYRNKILPYYETMSEFKKRFPNSKDVEEAYKWAKARVAFFKKEKGSKKELKKYKCFCKNITLFELVTIRHYLLFRLAIRLIQRNVI